METPVQIEFQGMNATEQVRRAIDEHIAELEDRFGHVIACRVVVRVYDVQAQFGRRGWKTADKDDVAGVLGTFLGVVAKNPLSEALGELSAVVVESPTCCERSIRVLVSLPARPSAQAVQQQGSVQRHGSQPSVHCE